MKIRLQSDEYRSSVINDATSLKQELHTQIPGYNRGKGIYTEMTTLSEQKKQSVKNRSRTLLTEYSYRMKTLLENADKDPSIYFEKQFETTISTLTAHFAHLYGRMQEYGISEQYFQTAILHEKSWGKQGALYKALVQLQLQETQKLQLSSPAYITTIQELLDKGYSLHTSDRKKIFFLEIFLSLSLSTTEKLEALLQIQPAKNNIHYHYVFIAYLHSVSESPLKAQFYLDKVGASWIPSSPYFTSLIEMTWDNINIKK